MIGLLTLLSVAVATLATPPGLVCNGPGLFPHYENCNKYYICSDRESIPTVMTCSQGEHFSFDNQNCIDEGMVNCQFGRGIALNYLRILPVEDLEVNTLGTATITTSTTPASIPALPNACPHFIDHKLYPHATDSSKFYYCVLGSLVERNCPYGHIFNQNQQICEGDINTESENGDAPQCNYAYGHMPHKTDCGKFWRCERSQAILGICSKGLHYNPTSETCDFASNVSCGADIKVMSVAKEGVKIWAPWNKVDEIFGKENL